MEIPYFFEALNRQAFVVKIKKPFLDWVNSTASRLGDDAVIGPEIASDSSTVYLVREMDHVDGMQRWLKKNFDDIFVNELNNWFTDENLWPANRTYKMFCDWFEVSEHIMVLDLEDTPLDKE